jgi:hypothetical protein
MKMKAKFALNISHHGPEQILFPRGNVHLNYDIKMVVVLTSEVGGMPLPVKAGW